MGRMAAAVAIAAIAPLAGASGALAHPHAAEHSHGDAGQVIANGQNHPAFINGESCETFTHLPGYGSAVRVRDGAPRGRRWRSREGRRLLSDRRPALAARSGFRSQSGNRIDKSERPTLLTPGESA
jgi:hypothetical protein